MLIKGLKFDLRLYALICGCDPLRIYLFKDGLVRFATEKYQKADDDNKTDMFRHLTNYAINKENPNFQANDTFEDDKNSHKRSLLAFFKELEEEGIDTKIIWLQIQDLINKTLCSIQPILKHASFLQSDDPYNQGYFEILGFDVLLD